MQLPKAMLKAIPKEYHDSSKGTLKLLWEDEWRSMGITQVCNALKRAGHTKLWGRDHGQDTDKVQQVLIRVLAEFGLGALRGSRTGAAHSALQVRPVWNTFLPSPPPGAANSHQCASARLVLVLARIQLKFATGGRSTTNHLHNEGSINTVATALRRHVYLISHSTTA